MNLVIMFLSLFSQPSYAVRTVMEGICSSANTIYVDTTNVRVGIGNCSPASPNKLDVSGQISVDTISITNKGTGLITTPGTQLTIQETGDASGTVSLTLENRNGLNGALFNNPNLALVDFQFQNSAGASFVSALRSESRNGSILGAGNSGTNDIGEWQFTNFGFRYTPIVAGVQTVALHGAFSGDVNGLVGIGTYSPSLKLDVNGSAQFGSGVTKSTFTSTGNLQLVSGSTITSNGTLSISTATKAATVSTPQIFIDPAGNVGISNKSPATALDVTGTIRQSTVVSCTGGVTTDASGGLTGCASSSAVVAVSSCTADLSGVPAITQSGHHFVLALSTITVTVNNTTYPVDVCFNGVLREVGSGPWHGWSFLVDSGYVFTMTRDFGCQSDTGGNPNQGAMVASGCCRLPKGTITNASHTFAFVPDGGLGNTIQAGFTNSVSYFCVNEVH